MPRNTEANAVAAKALAQYSTAYAIDTIAGPGKSRINKNYNNSFNSVQWLDEVLDGFNLSVVWR